MILKSFKILKVDSFIRILAIIFIVLINITGVHCKEKLTPYKIIGGANLNTNLYLSNFKELTRYPSCCTNYDFALGFGYGFFAGTEYVFEDAIFGINYSADILLFYHNLSAKYAIEEKLANIITGNDYVEAYSEHSLDAKINSIMIEPGLNIYPIINIPFGIRFGLKLGILSGMTFTQEENILSPDWITYKETGTKTKYHYEGEIPNASKIYSAISVGLKYDLIKSGSFSFSPIITFNYGLTNVTSDLDWKISTIQAGISIGYQIPQPKDVPPLPAPMPLLPKPPEPKEILVELTLKVNDKKMKNNDEIILPVKERKFINKFILLPIVFYEVNTNNMLTSDNTSRSEEEAQKNAYKSAVQYLKENSGISLTLVSSALSSEPSDVVQSRTENLKKMLVSSGINNDRLNIKDIVVDGAKLNKKELMQDNCFIRFEFSDGTEIIPYKSDTVVKNIIEPLAITIEPNVVSDLSIKEFFGTVRIDNEDIYDFSHDVSNFDLWFENMELKNNKLELIANLKDVFNNVKQNKQEYKLIYNIVNDGFYENVISDQEQSDFVQQFTLGYCDFDKAEFSYINNQAAELIKSAYKNKKIIEIIPLFDFLGTEEHNIKLATARANSAIDLLGMKKEDVLISIPKDYFFSNNNPYGRMMNRTVIVRIKNISGI